MPAAIGADRRPQPRIRLLSDTIVDAEIVSGLAHLGGGMYQRSAGEIDERWFTSALHPDELLDTLRDAPDDAATVESATIGVVVKPDVDLGVSAVASVASTPPAPDSWTRSRFGRWRSASLPNSSATSTDDQLTAARSRHGPRPAAAVHPHPPPPPNPKPENPVNSSHSRGFVRRGALVLTVLASPSPRAGAMTTPAPRATTTHPQRPTSTRPPRPRRRPRPRRSRYDRAQVRRNDDRGGAATGRVGGFRRARVMLALGVTPVARARLVRRPAVRDVAVGAGRTRRRPARDPAEHRTQFRTDRGARTRPDPRDLVGHDRRGLRHAVGDRTDGDPPDAAKSITACRGGSSCEITGRALGRSSKQPRSRPRWMNCSLRSRRTSRVQGRPLRWRSRSRSYRAPTRRATHEPGCSPNSASSPPPVRRARRRAVLLHGQRRGARHARHRRDRVARQRRVRIRGRERHAAAPVMRAYAEGREIIADPLLAAAFSHASPLSLEYVIEHLVPELALAVDGDPATPCRLALLEPTPAKTDVELTAEERRRPTRGRSCSTRTWRTTTRRAHGGRRGAASHRRVLHRGR